MMNAPSIYSPTELVKWQCAAEIGGKWVPARPLGFWGLCLRHRIKLAWSVFVGKNDVLKWDGQ